MERSNILIVKLHFGAVIGRWLLLRGDHLWRFHCISKLKLVCVILLYDVYFSLLKLTKKSQVIISYNGGGDGGGAFIAK